jgi:hypothetical protein
MVCHILLRHSKLFRQADKPRSLADVLKARLKTMGVVEHTFSISSGSNRGVQWRIYDVGGARNQRQAWAPYFEDGD